MTRKITTCLLLVLGLAGAAAGQDRLDREPGYVDLNEVAAWFDADATLEVNIKGALLELVAEASRYEDPDLASLLRKLKAIQVRGYPLSYGDFEAVERRTDEMGRRLKGRGWDTVLRTREDGERVDMYVKVHEGAIAGMVVMVIEPGGDDTIFLNIVGDIDPSEIGRIGRKFDIGPLGGTVTRQD